jgi:hypothetical protein
LFLHNCKPKVYSNLMKKARLGNGHMFAIRTGCLS